MSKSERSPKSDSGESALLKKTQSRYPLPETRHTTLEYRFTNSGHAYVVKKAASDGGDGKSKEVWVAVSSPFGVIARLLRLDDDEAYGLRMSVEDMSGKPRYIDFPRRDLAKMSGSDVRARLYDAGLRFEGPGEKVVVDALVAVSPGKKILVVSRPGWHFVGSYPHPIYVSPTGDVIGVLPVVVEAESSFIDGPPARQGTIEGWRSAIETATSVDNSWHWRFCAAAAFVGPIIDLLGLDTCGIHMSGMSSAGKTIAQRIAVSAWSSPRVGVALLRTWRSTDNALEPIAWMANGSVLALDEISHADGKEVAKIIFSLSSGASKSRMNETLTLQNTKTWNVFVLSSGEKSLEEKVTGEGGKWLAGMTVRFPDLDVSEVNRSVPRDTLNKIENGIKDNYGHAGVAFVRSFVDAGLHRDPDKLRERVHNAAQELAGPKADGLRLRSAHPFALVRIAGELAQEFGVLPDYDVKKTVDWAWKRYENSSDATALDPGLQVEESLRVWIASKWDVTIKCVFGEDKNNREAVAWYDEKCVYIPTNRIVEAAGGTLKQQEIVRILTRRELLYDREDNKRAAVRWVPGVGKVSAYALDREKVGRQAAPLTVVGAEES